jgi:hypothetical protein
MRLLIILFLLVCLSCNENSEYKKTEALTPLSKWLVNNEDSLFVQFNQKIKEDTINITKGNEVLTSREYRFEDGYLGQLTEKIHGLDSAIGVYYIYKPKEHPYVRILLTPELKKQPVGAIDSIFTDIHSLKYFQILKYRPPGSLFSAYIDQADTVKPDELHFKPIAKGNQFDLDIYVKKSLMRETKEDLLAQVFGEEVLLKRINKVNYIVTSNTVKHSMTLEEIRTFFGIKD